MIRIIIQRKEWTLGKFHGKLRSLSNYASPIDGLKSVTEFTNILFNVLISVVSGDRWLPAITRHDISQNAK